MFWHEHAKISRHTSQNVITEGDFIYILACNCEGTEQLQRKGVREDAFSWILQNVHKKEKTFKVYFRLPDYTEPVKNKRKENQQRVGLIL